jgi:tRNA 2-thiouridine synthesizing protein E
MSGYSAEDVRLLGDNVIGIMDIIKKLTQPDVLAFVSDATEAFYHPEDIKEVGLYGMFKASKEDDVRKGFGVLLSVLRSIGRGTDGVASLRKKKGPKSKRTREERKALVSAKLAPKKRAEPAEVPQRKVSVAKKATPATQAAEGTLEGFSADGYLIDTESWTEEIALAAASDLGFSELTDAHWKILKYSRSAYFDQGKSPNIRQITLGAEVETKEIYTLFPKAPGRTIAKIAGIPKPGGCL